jgi:hypothetical protein
MLWGKKSQRKNHFNLTPTRLGALQPPSTAVVSTSSIINSISTLSTPGTEYAICRELRCIRNCLQLHSMQKTPPVHKTRSAFYNSALSLHVKCVILRETHGLGCMRELPQSTWRERRRRLYAHLGLIASLIKRPI